MKKLIRIMVLVLIVSGITVTGVEASSNPERIFGRTRIETAIEVSKKAYTNADKVVLTGFDGEVDSLSGTILAHHKGAPMLVTTGDRLHDSVIKRLKELKTKEVYILGGEKAVSKQVENELRNLKYEVTRVAGGNREATAINIAKEVKGDNIDEVFLTLGHDKYADALAIGPVSGTKKKPIFLTKTNGIPKTTKDALKDLHVKRVTIIGGDAVVSKAVENELNSMGIQFNRVSGSNRMETALKIAKQYAYSPNGFVVANGYNYADALIGGYFSAKNNAPILLTQDKRIDIDSLDYIAEKKIQINILGGNKVVYNSVYEDIDFVLNQNMIIKDEIREFPIKYETIKENDSSLDKGREVIKQKGTDGIMEALDRVYYKDEEDYKKGEEFRSQNIITTITKKPINEIISVGTRK